MAYIAHLDLADNRTLHRAARWSELADQLGTPLRDYDGVPGDLSALKDFVGGANGFVLPNEVFLCAAELVDALHDRVSSGKRILVQSRWGRGEVDEFTRRYGIWATPIALHDNIARDDARVFELNRLDSPDSFAPHHLLDGVEDLLLQQPNVIQCDGTTSPILKLPADRVLAVDQQADLPADWTSRELSCIVLAPVSPHGGVLAVSCGFAHDPYTTVVGRNLPGIKAASNEQLAMNVLRWLGGENYESSLPVRAFELVDRIERSLVEFVVTILKQELSDWWNEGVPLAVRKPCAERAEEEGNRLPKGAYLDLMHVKSILEARWSLFEEAFGRVGWSGGKKRSLGWLSELNLVRRSVMHPTRRHFGPAAITPENISRLEEWSKKVDGLRITLGVVH